MKRLYTAKLNDSGLYHNRKIAYGTARCYDYRQQNKPNKIKGNFHEEVTALLLMLIGAIGVGIVPAEYFGIPERFSVFAATGFNAVLGAYLFGGFQARKEQGILRPGLGMMSG
jgi:hypothetical protein